MLDFFLFPVVNGQSTFCSFSSVESPDNNNFLLPHALRLAPSLPPNSKILGPPKQDPVVIFS